METEIIKTEDPNILIKRTVIETEINIEEAKSEYEKIVDELFVLNSRIKKLDSVVLPVGFEHFKDAELAGIREDIRILNERKLELSNLLNYGS